eukprot:CAMPEP_0182452374 /NCGR_PEP_ID=MMETSP1172-20130603/44215_1 /TAXON_ID=708627 /ORGANISM="Timspurckia oligopyrenoides, Strain CCMP3278" /LENGTH=295 /DNA_ID=CAMNT_0024650203 /DNA_START=538 /DNA_END=1425 /DNA_ORIENTATION=+
MVADSRNRESALRLLYGMVNFAMGYSRFAQSSPHPKLVCRRKMLADHFSEKLEPESYSPVNCCDVCFLSQMKTSTGEAQDVTRSAINAAQIVQRINNNGQTITLAALVDAWGSKGGKADGIRGEVPPEKSLSKLQREDVLVKLLVDDILSEHFHYTPYNIISYLIPGSRFGCLQQSNAKLYLLPLLDHKKLEQQRKSAVVQPVSSSVKRNAPEFAQNEASNKKRRRMRSLLLCRQQIAENLGAYPHNIFSESQLESLANVDIRNVSSSEAKSVLGNILGSYRANQFDSELLECLR